MLKLINDLIDQHSGKNKTALIDFSSGSAKNYTYDQMVVMAESVAAYLHDINHNHSERIGIVSDNSANYLFLFFGILKYGATAVLINKKLSRDHVADQILESKCSLLFSDDHESYEIKNINIKDFFNQLPLKSYKNSLIDPDQPAFVLFTSGSSGRPKGAVISHKRHVWNIASVSNNNKRHGQLKSLVTSPLFHSNGLTTIEGCFNIGSTVLLFPKFDAVQILENIESYKVDILFCVPSMLAMMLKHISEYDVSSVRYIRTASSQLSENLIAQTLKHFTNAEIINSYGCTELGPALFGPHPQGKKRPPNSVGYPRSGVEIKLNEGTLFVKTPGSMIGYLDSMNVNDWFNTGDVFRVDEEGFYYYLGRNDDMFKCGGNKVYPADVENILESHKDIVLSAVIGIEDDIKGHKPIAFVVIEKNSSITENEIKDYFLTKAPAYLCPRKIIFLDEIPLGTTGKIDKASLIEISTIRL